jgi:hypothetical protein
MSLIEVHECLEECMQRFHLSKLTFLLATLLALALMTAQMASAASLEDEWSIVKSPNGSLPQNTLNGIVAISQHDVWAVGDGQCLSDSCSKTLIEHWNGSQWSIVTSPNPGFTQNLLNGAVAISQHDVWAVGSFDSNGGSKVNTMVLHWNGSQWSIVTSPNRGSGDFFNAVAAVSAHDVWAGGAYFTTSHPNQTLIEHCC